MKQAAAIYGKVLQHNQMNKELADIVTKKNLLHPTPDVEADRWSSSAIKLVSAAGVMEGTSKNSHT